MRGKPTGARSLQAYGLRVLLFLALGLAAVGWMFSRPALPQDPSYHNFADQRTLHGIPHFWNVFSNIPFVVIGVWGLWCLTCAPTARFAQVFQESRERWPFLVLFLGIALTGFGSAWYHLQPNNDRLLWDRLPLAAAFMALFAAILGERLGPRIGSLLLFPLVVLGISSVLYWHWTESQGQGDLRLYYLVQFYPLLAIPLLVFLFPPQYTRSGDLFVALGWYVLAKLCEHPWDASIYAANHWLSGHTLKHLLAALGAYWILRMLQLRHPVWA
jgi:hypothetical protein